MNWKRVSMEIGKTLAILAALYGWLFGLRLAETFFYDETLKQWEPGSFVANSVMSMVGAVVAGSSVWGIYKFFDWLVFCDKKPKNVKENKPKNQKQ